MDYKEEEKIVMWFLPASSSWHSTSASVLSSGTARGILKFNSIALVRKPNIPAEPSALLKRLEDFPSTQSGHALLSAVIVAFIIFKGKEYTATPSVFALASVGSTPQDKRTVTVPVEPEGATTFKLSAD